MPLDEQRLRSTLINLSRTSLAGAIVQDGMTAVHSFGDADSDARVRDVKMRCRPANTAPRAALVELEKLGFRPESTLEFQSPGDYESREDAWTLVGLYGEELLGWVITSYVDFDEAVRRIGSDEGLIHAPVGGKHRGVIIAASALRLLTS